MNSLHIPQREVEAIQMYTTSHLTQREMEDLLASSTVTRQNEQERTLLVVDILEEQRATYTI